MASQANLCGCIGHERCDTVEREEWRCRACASAARDDAIGPRAGGTGSRGRRRPGCRAAAPAWPAVAPTGPQQLELTWRRFRVGWTPLSRGGRGRGGLDGLASGAARAPRRRRGERGVDVGRQTYGPARGRRGRGGRSGGPKNRARPQRLGGPSRTCSAGWGRRLSPVTFIEHVGRSSAGCAGTGFGGSRSSPLLRGVAHAWRLPRQRHFRPSGPGSCNSR